MTEHVHATVVDRAGFASWSVGVSRGSGVVRNVAFGTADDCASAWGRVVAYMGGRIEAGRAHREGSPPSLMEGPGLAGGASGGPLDEGFA